MGTIVDILIIMVMYIDASFLRSRKALVGVSFGSEFGGWMDG